MTRVAAVTGGAGAIGGAIAAGLRAAGHQVVILDRDSDPPADLAEPDAVRAAAAGLLATHGRCDVLVHAAAAFDRAALPDLDPRTWRRVQAVNVESAVWLAQALAPGMAERGFGRIVFVVSDTIWDPPAGDLLAYVASKAALVGVAGTPPEAFAAVRARQAIGRDLEPGDIAAAVAFLVSDPAGAITGQTLCADGGLILR